MLEYIFILGNLYILKETATKFGDQCVYPMDQIFQRTMSQKIELLIS